jgi:phosphoglycerate dehydrogenase-like enzyme
MPGGVVLVDPYPRTLDQIFMPATRARLELLGEVVWHDGPPAPAELIDRHLPDAVAVVGQTPLPRERLDRAPRLRAILNVEGNFLPNVDYDKCFDRGIHVLTTGPVFADAVAELALGLALAAARDIPRADAWMREGTEVLYDEGVNGDAFLLSGGPLGVVGVGAIGRRLSALLRPFGSELLGHDPWLDDAVLCEEGLTPVALDELFSRCHVVFLVAAATVENEGSIGAELLGLLRPGSVVVLASRAAIVDWDALLDAAESGRIRIAIDVFPEEPIPPDARVRSIPNAILSAHRAGNVPEVWPQMGAMVADDLEAILAGGLPFRCQLARRETVRLLRSKPIG